MVHVTVLLAIAALLANCQCYARCISSGPYSSHADVGCHHTPNPKHRGQPQCECQGELAAANAEATVEVTKAPVLFVPMHTLVPAVSAASFVDRRTSTKDLLSERASPPDKPLFLAISVLRV